jgi:hypothetical protein
MSVPGLDGDAQARADRAARRRTLQSWGVALIALIIIGFRLWSRGVAEPVAPHEPRDGTLAPLWAAGAVATAVLAVATNAFTFRYDRPIWRWMRFRLLLSFVAVVLFAMLAFVPFADAAAARFGLDPMQQKMSLFAFIALAVAGFQFAAVRVCRSGVLRRVRARGATEEDLMRGSLVTLAPADVKPGTRSRAFEAGLLWIDGSELRFVGDLFDVRAAPGQVQLTREVIPGTFLGLLGRKGLVLTLPEADGPIRARVSPLAAILPRTELEWVERISAQIAGWQAG